MVAGRDGVVVEQVTDPSLCICTQEAKSEKEAGLTMKLKARLQ